MITEPGVVRVLCFGDSNTHGTPSDDPDYVRLSAGRRWTGALQSLLGDAYDVVEEGLAGRTTDLDYDDRPGCHGRAYFVPCLQSHHPLDVVVVMLGTNDLKTCFGRTADEVADALGGYVDDVAAYVTDPHGRTPVTVLVAPIVIDDGAPDYAASTGESFDPAGVRRSHELGAAIRRVALARGATYADAAEVARAGRDGLHLTLDSHGPLAASLAGTVTDVLARRQAHVVAPEHGSVGGIES